MTGFEVPSAHDVDVLVMRWRAASAEFAALLDRYGLAAPALRHFGLMQWQALRHDVASAAFLAAVSLAPDDSRVWADLAGVYDGLADLESAELCIRRAVALAPALSQSWLMLAGLLTRRGDPSGAEASYLAAVAIEPTLADAHFGLGILCFDQRRLDEAVDNLTCAIEQAPAHMLARTCLGHVYYSMGQFAAASAAFASAAPLGVPDRNTRLKHARARTFQAMIDGGTEEALAVYPELLGSDAEEIPTILRDAFGLLSAFGFTSAAVDVGRKLLRHDPKDPVQLYLQAVIEGVPHSSAPVDYVEAYFDRFAADFDHKLVEILQYRVPEQLTALVARRRAGFERIVDLGCGTGLSADHLAAFGGDLIGVDVAGKMLERARERGRYTELVKAEAVAFLDANRGCFDLVFAADLLVYIGDLDPLFRTASAALRSGGLFAVSVERGPPADFTLLRSGRFAHSSGYIERLAREDFDRLDEADTMIRLEASRPVDGKLFVYRRR